jgi:hypothetical protein
MVGGGGGVGTGVGIVFATEEVGDGSGTSALGVAFPQPETSIPRAQINASERVEGRVKGMPLS